MPLDHTRHSGIFDISQRSATLIGCGGIGALTAITLGKMGIGSLRLFDDDKVDLINLATQFHKTSDVGYPKVDTVGNNVLDFAGDVHIEPCLYRVTEETDLRDWVTISAVDSIAARLDIWSAALYSRPRWYLDARMSAEVFHLYTVDMENDASIKFYNDIITTFDDNDVAEVPCTEKATIYCSCISAGEIAKTIRQIHTGITPPKYIVLDIVHDAMTVIQ